MGASGRRARGLRGARLPAHPRVLLEDLALGLAMPLRDLPGHGHGGAPQPGPPVLRRRRVRVGGRAGLAAAHVGRDGGAGRSHGRRAVAHAVRGPLGGLLRRPAPADAGRVEAARAGLPHRVLRRRPRRRGLRPRRAPAAVAAAARGVQLHGPLPPEAPVRGPDSRQHGRGALRVLQALGPQAAALRPPGVRAAVPGVRKDAGLALEPELLCDGRAAGAGAAEEDGADRRRAADARLEHPGE
mmetsp:Transcript_129419/g.360479  ORF Transcript_129419/g.360479 Transcript_129419/m.360479 type:complete len:242 (+) Transcript_129419:1090-1815(+)